MDCDPLTTPLIPSTRIVRLDAAGPEPANTLVHLHCEIPGVKERGFYGSASCFQLKFVTEYHLAGYDQRLYDWYLANTHVSATVMFRKLAATTDFIFTIALERVESFIQFNDGALGFVVTHTSVVDDEAVFPESYNEFTLGGTVSAWVLCYEPPIDKRPPSGSQPTSWAAMTEKGPRLAQVDRRVPVQMTESSVALELPPRRMRADPERC